MAEQIKKEKNPGGKVVEGPKIYFWVLSVLAAITTFSVFEFGNLLDRSIYIGPVAIGFPSIGFPIGDRGSLLFLALYVVALVGLYIRKGWAIPVGRAALVVSMVVLFPVGTIFGAILWKRFNDPVAKRYLNYGESVDTEKEDKASKESDKKE